MEFGVLGIEWGRWLGDQQVFNMAAFGIPPAVMFATNQIHPPWRDVWLGT